MWAWLGVYVVAVFLVVGTELDARVRAGLGWRGLGVRVWMMLRCQARVVRGWVVLRVRLVGIDVRRRWALLRAAWVLFRVSVPVWGFTRGVRVAAVSADSCFLVTLRCRGWSLRLTFPISGVALFGSFRWGSGVVFFRL